MLKLEDLDGVMLRASDAFLVMGAYVREFSQRVKVESALATLQAGIEVEADGSSGDPAALEDWLQCVREVSGADRQQRG